MAELSRSKVGFMTGVFGIITNLMAFGVKIVAGLISGSVTVAADAMNSLADAGSSILTIVGFKLSEKPADLDHPYGHARYEQITALVISLIMLAVGGMFLKSSVEKIVTPEELTIGTVSYIALTAAVLLKAVQAAVYYIFSKKINSQALLASSLDSRNDAVITISVLISVIIMGFSGVNIDGWAGLLVSLFIIISSAKMVRDAISPMLGSAPPEELVESLNELVRSKPDILGSHDLIVHNYGADTNFASVHAEVDSKGDMVYLHGVIDSIEQEAKERLGVSLTIHMDPVDVGVGMEKDEEDQA